MTDPVRVLLLDDHEMLLRGLSLLFRTIPECQVVATTTDGARVPELVEQTGPEVAITDTAIPGTDGPAVVRACRRSS